MRTELVVLLLCAAIIALAPGQAQLSPDGAVYTLWGHGEVRDGDVEGVTTQEVIWMNGDPGDARATDTANGPGYCPVAPATGLNLPTVGDPACLVENQARPGGTIEHTFTLAMDPALADGLELDPDGLVLFEVALGASSGTCTGTYVATLSADGETVAQTEPVEFSYDSGYVLFPGEAAVQLASLAAEADLVWVLEVTCDGTGLFLGVHADTGRTKLVLPLAGASDEPDEDPDLNMTLGNQTDDVGNETDDPTVDDDDDPGAAGGNQAAPSGADDTEEDDAAAPTPARNETRAESSGIPGPGVALVMTALALVAWVRRR